MNYKRAFYALIIAILLVAGGIALFSNNLANKNQVAPANSAGQGTNLDYSNQGLTHFPKEALSHPDATSLNLSHNNLTGALPAEIKNLRNLQTLDVSYNDMTGIPAEIGQMHNLKNLNYSYNQITGLPNELGSLTQLQVLNLRGNPNISQHDLSGIRAKLTTTDIKL